jgi:hypothetical protein
VSGKVADVGYMIMGMGHGLDSSGWGLGTPTWCAERGNPGVDVRW